MPVMDGLAFLKSLDEQQRREIAVVILSGYSDFEYAKQAMCLGAKWYLIKPVDVIEAGECLDKLRGELEARGTEPKPVLPQRGLGEAAAWLAYVEENFRLPLTIRQVAEHFHMNPAYLGRLFQKAAGMNLKHYLTHLRLQEAKRLLRTTDMFVYEIAEELGFSESSYFISRFMREEGISPMAYRNG
jgi:YesN/AraC family two-component response regulator